VIAPIVEFGLYSAVLFGVWPIDLPIHRISNRRPTDPRPTDRHASGGSQPARLPSARPASFDGIIRLSRAPYGHVIDDRCPDENNYAATTVKSRRPGRRRYVLGQLFTGHGQSCTASSCSVRALYRYITPAPDLRVFVVIRRRRH